MRPYTHQISAVVESSLSESKSESESELSESESSSLYGNSTFVLHSM